MAFNADEYISTIVEQIADNFKELDRALNKCEELKYAKEAYQALPEEGVSSFLHAYKKSEILQRDIRTLACQYYRTVESLSVGLFGEQGSGKTYLLKLIELKVTDIQLDEEARKFEKRTFPQLTIPIFFNAWRFEQEPIIVSIFRMMLASIETFENENRGEALTQQLGQTKGRLKLLLFALVKGFQLPHHVPTTVANLMKGDVTGIADFMMDMNKVSAGSEEDNETVITEENLQEFLESDRMETIYMNIPQWMEKIAIVDNISFVFLIDDLDKCLPENTLKVLESIKLYLDVPSCAFVLAVDDDVIEREVVQHYRSDTQQEESNLPVNLESELLLHNAEEHRVLPVTGHGYLEKMVELPFRIPIIDEKNVEAFLRTNYLSIFIQLDNETEKLEDIENRQGVRKKSDEVIDFLAKNIPPKPRKIKRTAKLFDTKLKMLERLDIEINPILVAKITLLELFAPQLLRFIQMNGYRRIYNRLVYFRNFRRGGENPSLRNRTTILEHIDSFEQEEQEFFRELMTIVQESYSAEVGFELDNIFDEEVKQESLKENIELQKTGEKKKSSKKQTSLSNSTFMIKLQRENDSSSWQDAFEDNTLFAEGKAILSEIQLKKVLILGQRETALVKNPEWIGIIAQHLSDEQYVQLLKELYHFRFANINGRFEMGIYPVTFWEYDRYCEIVHLEKPNDQGWGRGKRPVIDISWEEATAYAQWLSEALGHTYRLPTEQEWYLACNDNRDREWHFGKNEIKLVKYAWYDKNSNGNTHTVGQKEPNSFNLYDMHGNVWEWCADWSSVEQEYKALRGGSWNLSAHYTRSASRGRLKPTVRGDYVGFRLLRSSR